MSDFDQCLRPVFTQRIVRLLQRGRSINVFGGEDDERERLLEDMRQMTLPDTTTLLVNMKQYRLTYDGLLRELWSQLGRKDEKPENISELIERYEGQDGRLFMLMQNFDALLGTPDVAAQYNVAFYDALNYVKNRPNIALACATQNPHDQSIVFVDGQAHRTSWIDLEAMRLPALTHEEIVLEVKRQLPQILLQERSTVIKVVREHKNPYKLLTYLRDKLLNRENAELVFPKKLKLWLKQFQRDEKRRLLSMNRGLRTRERVSVLSKVTGISSLKDIFTGLTKPLKLITDILENFAQKGKKNDDK